MTRPARSRPRLSGPGELLAALPLLLGFAPRESLVVVCLQDDDRVGLVARYDLPAPDLRAAAVEDLAGRLRVEGTRRAFAVVVSEGEGPGLPERELVGLLRGLPADLVDVLLLRSGRWWSYLCATRSCCPAEGRPVPDATPALTLVRAQAALDGRAVLPSREALVRSLAAPTVPGPHLEVLRAVEQRIGEEVLARTRRRVRQRLLLAWRAALDADRLPAPEAAAELVLALHEVQVRDQVLTWSVRRGERLLAVLLHLARATPAPYDAPLCSCLAWVAYTRGDGATARTALDRALGTEPGYGLALLLVEALEQQVPPRALQAVGVRVSASRGRRR